MSIRETGEPSPPPSTLHTAAQWPSTAFDSSALRSLPDDLPPSDPRVVLQAVLALWTQAPATLAGTAAVETLRATATRFVRPATEPATATSGEPGTTTDAASGHIRNSATAATETGTPATRPPPDDVSRGATAARPTATAARQDNERATENASPHPDLDRVSSTAASPAVLPPAAEHDFRTRGGGFFFLLNVLNLPALRDWRATLAEPHSGWRELVRLARRLDFTPDAPLAAFLADACALAPNDTPVDDPAAALAALPPGADPAPVRHAALRHYGEAALAAALAERPAHVRATASHLDVQLRVADVHLDIRRTGLDLDPGWLPWLGRVVRFHYD